MSNNMPSAEEVHNNVILATGGYDHTIHFWQAHTGVRQSSVQHPSSQVNSMEIAPKMNLLAVAGFQHIRMYDIFSSNPNPVVNYEGAAKNFISVGFPEDSRWMYTGSEDCSAKMWDLKSRMLQCQRFFNASAPVNCTCLHPNQVELFIGDQSGAIYLWDLRVSDQTTVKKPFFKVSEPHVSIQSIDIDAEGTYMAAVDNKGNCYIFLLSYQTESSHSQPVRFLKFSAHNTYGLKCKFSPDSTLLATTSADCSAKLWRTADLNILPSSVPKDSQDTSNNFEWKKTAPMTELRHANQRWVWDLAFSLDSQYLFTASSDNLARLWCISKGEVKRDYTGHSKALTALAFRDGGATASS
ncbi:target of rapamycin complex subunit lst8 [Parasteatoda tepidariorum]|uniref:target of rapamycin complex subunit lst8 n=1 Tax=Parasteatoda tepidariorum TaxID=114398 RepID=UPI00077F9628|nr:target of rapamycin complex subunit lst8 [Parasteatoda tepidariorum]